MLLAIVLATGNDFHSVGPATENTLVFWGAVFDGQVAPRGLLDMLVD